MTDLEQPRIATAMRRAVAARRSARYHEQQAASERAKIATLARTWGFTAAEVEEAGELESFPLTNPPR